MRFVNLLIIVVIELASVILNLYITMDILPTLHAGRHSSRLSTLGWGDDNLLVDDDPAIVAHHRGVEHRRNINLLDLRCPVASHELEVKRIDRRHIGQLAEGVERSVERRRGRVVARALLVGVLHRKEYLRRVGRLDLVVAVKERRLRHTAQHRDRRTNPLEALHLDLQVVALNHRVSREVVAFGRKERIQLGAVVDHNGLRHAVKQMLGGVEDVALVDVVTRRGNVLQVVVADGVGVGLHLIEAILVAHHRYGRAERVGYEVVLACGNTDIPVEIVATLVAALILQKTLGYEFVGRGIKHSNAHNLWARVFGMLERRVVEVASNVLDLLVEVDANVVSVVGIAQRAMLARGVEQRADCGKEDGQQISHFLPPFLSLAVMGTTSDTCALVSPK